MKSFFKEVIIPSLVIIIIGVAIFGGIGILLEANTHTDSLEQYNNGICSKCGGTYKYSQAVGHRYETCYIYICENCDNLIETVDYYGR